jgi:hypothetical protein
MSALSSELSSSLCMTCVLKSKTLSAIYSCLFMLLLNKRIDESYLPLPSPTFFGDHRYKVVVFWHFACQCYRSRLKRHCLPAHEEAEIVLLPTNLSEAASIHVLQLISTTQVCSFSIRETNSNADRFPNPIFQNLESSYLAMESNINRHSLYSS